MYAFNYRPTGQLPSDSGQGDPHLQESGVFPNSGLSSSRQPVFSGRDGSGRPRPFSGSRTAVACRRLSDQAVELARWPGCFLATKAARGCSGRTSLALYCSCASSPRMDFRQGHSLATGQTSRDSCRKNMGNSCLLLPPFPSDNWQKHSVAALKATRHRTHFPPGRFQTALETEAGREDGILARATADPLRRQGQTSSSVSPFRQGQVYSGADSIHPGSTGSQHSPTRPGCPSWATGATDGQYGLCRFAGQYGSGCDPRK